MSTTQQTFLILGASLAGAKAAQELRNQGFEGEVLLIGAGVRSRSWLADEKVLAGMNVNVWDVNEQVQDLIRSRAEVDTAALADPDTPLDAVSSRAPARTKL